MGDAVHQTISFVIRHPDDAGKLLAVLRPPDDADLPDAWGLPAGRIRPGESPADAVRRAGREKLGVELEVGRELNRGSVQRAAYRLEMQLFEATIVRGEPRVPQPHAEVTQYRAWRWARRDVLRPAADRGSLCCRLCLEVAP